MKSNKKFEKKHCPRDLAEAYVFPVCLSSSERTELLSAVEAYRRGSKKGKEKENDKITLLSLKGKNEKSRRPNSI